MKPLIGVTPDFNAGDRKEWGGREPTYFLRARYIRAIEDLGGIPIVLPLVADLAARRRLLTSIDGLLLTGSGPDLAPELYGERQRYKFRVMSQRRATFELEMAQLARTADLPLLGICGGMQALNVAFGGSLYQDIGSQRPHPLQHRQSAPATQLQSSGEDHSEKPPASDRQDRDHARQQLPSSIGQGCRPVAPGQCTGPGRHHRSH